MKLSIIITNYNYANYLSEAIDSALALEWDDKEVIVADDGSTDNSHKVIEAYGSRIIPLFLSNGGQSSACNAAFQHSCGDIIVFLDSDDVLFPSAADTLRSVWSDRIAKLQWSFVVTDEKLQPLGVYLPAYRTKPTPELVLKMVARTGYFPYSITGAWARSFLCQVFPVPVRIREGINKGGANGDPRAPVIDRYLSMLAPFFGDVICISADKPQGAYRMHGDNALVLWETPQPLSVVRVTLGLRRLSIVPWTPVTQTYSRQPERIQPSILSAAMRRFTALTPMPRTLRRSVTEWLGRH